MIKQVHVSECDSTQDLLKEQLNSLGDQTVILVSCENQLSGRGRGENKWKAMPGTLCLSTNIKPHPVMSYTALELSVLVAKFFESRGRELKLKWPNDLWDTSLKKCGGILVQGNQHNLIAGMGINLYSTDEALGAIYPTPFEINKQHWSLDLGTFVHENRIQSTEVLREEWLNRCGHLRAKVRVTEGSDIFEGEFLGLGDFGEALVQSSGETLRIFNGSLRLL